MPFPGRCAVVCGSLKGACALGLLVVTAVLVPLAYASPPDPVWVAGIYSAADFDEAVWLLIHLSIGQACGCAAYHVGPRARGVTCRIVPLPISVRPAATSPRAPPIA